MFIYLVLLAILRVVEMVNPCPNIQLQSTALKHIKIFLSNADELIMHKTLRLLLQNNRDEPEPYSHIN